MGMPRGPKVAFLHIILIFEYLFNLKNCYYGETYQGESSEVFELASSKLK